MPKMKFITDFFSEILHFQESCNLIGWQHFDPLLEKQNFARYGIGGDISTTKLFSILDWLQEKLMTTFFKKSKKPFLQPFWTLLPIGQKWIFLEKRALSVFIYSNYQPSCQKTEKHNEPFLIKTPKQTDNSDFIGPSVGRESKNSNL